jgi:hypothetical protein
MAHINVRLKHGEPQAQPRDLFRASIQTRPEVVEVMR